MLHVRKVSLKLTDVGRLLVELLFGFASRWRQKTVFDLLLECVVELLQLLVLKLRQSMA